MKSASNLSKGYKTVSTTWRAAPSVIAIGFAIVAFIWTPIGESSDPVLAVRELPLDVLRCVGPAGTLSTPGCQRDEQYTNRWIARTRHGNLFLVRRAPCGAPGSCPVWLVEKTERGTSTLLAVEGEFRLYRGTGRYPAVQVRADVSANQRAYSRFEWTGSTYARTENRLVYDVDGTECGTHEECRERASEALRHQHIDRAVKIWEQVHGISWI